MKTYVHNGTVTAFQLWNPRGPRVPRGLRGRRAGQRHDHRQGRRDVQGRQARQVHDHHGRGRTAAGDPRAAVHVHHRERRQVQLLGRKMGAPRRAAPPSHPTIVTTTQPGPVLSLEHAEKSFGAVHALEDGDIQLFAGEVHGLVGRERRRQVDARQDPRRRPPARRRPAACSTARRRSSTTPSSRRRPGSRSSSRSRRSSPT